MENRVYQVQACRGLQGGCRFALWTSPSVVEALEQRITASAWVRRVSAVHGGGAVSPHARLTVALAACPNACSMPQIRDIGVIATLTPRSVRPQCDACGACERLCREGAIRVSDTRAELDRGRCVGCGACVAACPREAIGSAPVRLRILVGGRMGRHPRWAEPLCTVDTEDGIDALDACLDHLAQEVRGRERPADVVERTGVEVLRRHVLHALSERSMQEHSG